MGERKVSARELHEQRRALANLFRRRTEPLDGQTLARILLCEPGLVDVGALQERLNSALGVVVMSEAEEESLRRAKREEHEARTAEQCREKELQRQIFEDRQAEIEKRREDMRYIFDTIKEYGGRKGNERDLAEVFGVPLSAVKSGEKAIYEAMQEAKV